MGIERLTKAARAAGFAMVPAEDHTHDDPTQGVWRVPPSESRALTVVKAAEPAAAGSWMRSLTGLLTRRSATA